MKYLLSLCIGLVVCITAAHAQDSTLQQYTGKYRFAAGNPIPEVDVILQDGALMMSSAAGSSPLRREQGDQFTITAFNNGLALFTRNPQGKVAGVHIEAMGYVMDGTKDEVPALAALLPNRRVWMSVRK